MPVAEERGVTKAQAKVCSCESCKKGRGEQSKITPIALHSYHSSPSGGWVKQRTPRDADAPLFMGVELETDVRHPSAEDYAVRRAQDMAIDTELTRLIGDEPRLPNHLNVWNLETVAEQDEYSAFVREREDWFRRRSREEGRLYNAGFGLPPVKSRGASIVATAEEAVSMAEPGDFWHPKYDGSVSGPEFASLPATLEYWYSLRPSLDSMFTNLLHAGVRSHTGDNAGMHVSVNVDVFTGSEHLMRFARLVNHHPRWARRMSQRTEASLTWCHLGRGVFDPHSPRRLTDWAEYVMRYGETGGDRYEAINATCGGGRIEFRLPRGTLRLDRFYKNLEWVASMIEFTRDYASTGSSDYMRWVMAQDRFPNLQSFLTEKFGLSRTDASSVTGLPVATNIGVPNALASGVYVSPFGRIEEDEDEDSFDDGYEDDGRGFFDAFGPEYEAAEEAVALRNECISQSRLPFGRSYQCRQPGYNNGPRRNGSVLASFQCERHPEHVGPHAWAPDGAEVVTWEVHLVDAVVIRGADLATR